MANISPSWNSGFDIWQRATSFSLTGGVSQYTCDRTINGPGAGGAATVTRQEFPLGQTDVPGNPIYFHRMEWTTGPTAGEGRSGYNLYFSSHESRHEQIKRFSGQTITVSFWARTGGTTSFFIFASMGMGAGGNHGKSGNSISGNGAGVDYNHLATEIFYRNSIFNIGTTWSRYSATFTLDDLASATVGTSSVLTVGIGTNKDGVTAGTLIDLAFLQVDWGSAPQDPVRREYGEMAMLAKRFHYRISQLHGITNGTSSIEASFDHPTLMYLPGPQISMALSTPAFLTGSAGSVGHSVGSGSTWTTATANQKGIRGSVGGFSGLAIGYPALARSDPIIILSVE